ncbi:MAG: hypothetical protein ABWW66_03475 [Archaeoglobaceae archaeon]
MKLDFATGVGLVIGMLFGFSGISTLFAYMSEVVSEAQTQLQQIGVASTLVLLVFAVIVIVKVRAVASLIVGAILGAVINAILEANNISFLEVLRKLLLG